LLTHRSSVTTSQTYVHLSPEDLRAELARAGFGEATAWVFGTANGKPVEPRNFFRQWEKARNQVGRTDLTIHDLRHSGLTWSAATGAPLAELMRRGGHKDSRAAVRYQQATRDSGKVLADALAAR
jgi:integrase